MTQTLRTADAYRYRATRAIASCRGVVVRRGVYSYTWWRGVVACFHVMQPSWLAVFHVMQLTAIRNLFNNSSNKCGTPSGRSFSQGLLEGCSACVLLCPACAHRKMPILDRGPWCVLGCRGVQKLSRRRCCTPRTVFGDRPDKGVPVV